MDTLIGLPEFPSIDEHGFWSKSEYACFALTSCYAHKLTREQNEFVGRILSAVCQELENDTFRFMDNQLKSDPDLYHYFDHQNHDPTLIRDFSFDDCVYEYGTSKYRWHIHFILNVRNTRNFLIDLKIIKDHLNHILNNFLLMVGDDELSGLEYGPGSTDIRFVHVYTTYTRKNQEEYNRMKRILREIEELGINGPGGASSTDSSSSEEGNAPGTPPGGDDSSSSEEETPPPRPPSEKTPYRFAMEGKETIYKRDKPEMRKSEYQFISDLQKFDNIGPYPTRKRVARAKRNLRRRGRR